MPRSTRSAGRIIAGRQRASTALRGRAIESMRGCSTARACEIDPGTPRLVQGVNGRIDHARERL